MKFLAFLATGLCFDLFVYFSVSACHPFMDGDKVTFKLNLQDIYQCMVTRVLDKATVLFLIYIAQHLQ